MTKRFILIAGIAFGLHFVWESNHVVLYGGYDHLTTLPIAVWAAIGDVVYTFAMYLLIALIKRDMRWVERMRWTDAAAVSIMGFFLVLIVEYKAMVFDRWFYLDTMPIVPLLGIGLTPLLQKVTLFTLTFYLVKLMPEKLWPLKRKRA